MYLCVISFGADHKQGYCNRLAFFTNVKNLPTVDGVDFVRFFEENQIQVVYLELTRKTPKDWYGAWRNQFYLFDVLEYLKNLEAII